MMLIWDGFVSTAEGMTASGLRGTYTVRWVSSLGYTLTARGWDDLPLLCLPPFGRIFDTLDQAKDYAVVIERTAVEPEVSGA